MKQFSPIHFGFTLKPKLTKKAILTFVITLLIAYSGFAQTITSAAYGNWNAPTTWVGGIVPAVGNCTKVVIAHGVAVNVNTSLSCGLEINTSKRLNIKPGVVFNVDCASDFSVGFTNKRNGENGKAINFKRIV